VRVFAPSLSHADTSVGRRGMATGGGVLSLVAGRTANERQSTVPGSARAVKLQQSRRRRRFR